MFANYIKAMNFARRLIVTISTIICLTNIYNSAKAQADQTTGNWNVLILKGKISPRLSVMSEEHIRSTNSDFKYDYFEVKAGISYLIAKNLAGLFGFGFYNTYIPGGLFQTPAKQKEFRTWLELSYKQSYNRFYFDHRVRLEQRFIPNNYKNRLKYRLALMLPVNKTELVAGSIFLSVNDELWFPQYGPFIEKNRLFAGAGYKLNPNTTFQVGCVSDNDYKPDSHTLKNYLQIMVIYDFSKLVKKHS